VDSVITLNLFLEALNLKHFMNRFLLALGIAFATLSIQAQTVTIADIHFGINKSTHSHIAKKLLLDPFTGIASSFWHVLKFSPSSGESLHLNLPQGCKDKFSTIQGDVLLHGTVQEEAINIGRLPQEVYLLEAWHIGEHRKGRVERL